MIFLGHTGYSLSSSCPCWVKMQASENLQSAQKIAFTLPIMLGSVTDLSDATCAILSIALGL